MKVFVLLIGIFFSFNFSICSAAYYTMKMVEPNENYSMKYDDENMLISFAMERKNPDRVLVSIYNRTDSPMTIKWSESSLIFSDKARSVLPGSQIATGMNVYSGIKDTKIPPHTSIEESIFAEGNIKYVRSSSPVTVQGGIGRSRGWGRPRGLSIGFDDIWFDRSGVWKTVSFFPAPRTDIEKTNLLGNKLGVYLTLKINDQEYNKRFDFAIDKVTTDEVPGSLGLIVDDSYELTIMKKDHNIESGVLVVALSKKSPAKEAGLLVGDNIIKIGSSTINDIEDFVKYINNKKAKDIISITYIREGKEHKATIQLKKV